LGNSILHTPIEYLKGVGPQRGETLRKELEIHFYKDLVHLFPNRYIDKTKYYKVNEINNTYSEVQLVGKIIHLKSVASNNKNRQSMRLVATFADDTGEMELVWFKGQQWIRENIKLNIPYVIFGKPTKFGNSYNIAHPEMELLSEHEKNIRVAMKPVYPSTEKLQKKGITNKLIHNYIRQVFTETHHLFEETLPDDIRQELQLIPKREALIAVHFPKDQTILSKAQFRLKFEELFFIQLQLLRKKCCTL
jgi:ATP-dependent DNA helicase RecG